jgi:hypothetical protein
MKVKYTVEAEITVDAWIGNQSDKEQLKSVKEFAKWIESAEIGSSNAGQLSIKLKNIKRKSR